LLFALSAIKFFQKNIKMKVLQKIIFKKQEMFWINVDFYIQTKKKVPKSLVLQSL
jgi:hypothetical protein